MGKITHKPYGTRLTRAEWEDENAHVDSQGNSLVVTGSATYIIAASNTPALIKAQANAVYGETSTDEIQVAHDAGYKHIKLTEGTFTPAVYWSFTSTGFCLEGSGDSTIINVSSLSYGASGVIRALGAITATNTTLASDASACQRDLVVTDASSFAVGDWVRVRSETAFYGTQKKAEMQRIASIVGNTITCELALNDTYTTTDTGTIDLLTVRDGVTLSNFKIVGAGANQGGIIFKQCFKPDIFFELRVEHNNIAQNKIIAIINPGLFNIFQIRVFFHDQKPRLVAI